jgi:hypothetical protein
LLYNDHDDEIMLLRDVSEAIKASHYLTALLTLAERIDALQAQRGYKLSPYNPKEHECS